MSSLVGTTIEWYDFFLYGTAAALVLWALFLGLVVGHAAMYAPQGALALDRGEILGRAIVIT